MTVREIHAELQEESVVERCEEHLNVGGSRLTQRRREQAFARRVGRMTVAEQQQREVVLSGRERDLERALRDATAGRYARGVERVAASDPLLDRVDPSFATEAVEVRKSAWSAVERAIRPSVGLGAVRGSTKAGAVSPMASAYLSTSAAAYADGAAGAFFSTCSNHKRAASPSFCVT